MTTPSRDTGPAASGTTTHDDVNGTPPKHDDGPLESIGKAIVDPVTTAAADEEPGPDGQPRVRPGG